MVHPHKIAAKAISDYLEKILVIKNDEYLGQLLLYLFCSARILQINVLNVAEWIQYNGKKEIEITGTFKTNQYGINFSDDTEITTIVDMCFKMVLDIKKVIRVNH
jgi:hypothetical protein